MRRAFTLVEMAIVLFIVSILVGMGVFTFVTATRGAKVSATKEGLSAGLNALVGFATSNSRLPCPDINCDGVEDLCLDPAGCDFDGDGSPETPYNHCASELVENGTITINNPNCKTVDFASSPAKVPPYLLPYTTLGTSDADGFTRPWRYDVNKYLARGGLNAERFCSLLAFFSKNYDKSGNVNPAYLPIVTSDADGNDDNFIAVSGGVPTGYSVAGVIISEGICPGVSGKNGGANKEYEKASKGVTSQECTGYDDFLKEVSFNYLLDRVCSGVNYSKVFYLHVEDASNFSVEVFDGTTWHCYSPNYPADTSMTIVIDISEDKDNVRFYPNNACAGTPILIPDIIAEDSDGDGHVVLKSTGSLSDEDVIEVFAKVGTSFNDGGCVDANDPDINTFLFPIDAQMDTKEFYPTAGCSGASSATLKDLYMKDLDVRNDRMVLFNGTAEELLANAPSGYRYKILQVSMASGTSYIAYPDFKCVDITNPAGEVKKFEIGRLVILFDGAGCTGNHYFIHELLYQNANGTNDGFVSFP
jgi:prepilin-type N-terminal cleavage/methylation domain-containing protein